MSGTLLSGPDRSATAGDANEQTRLGINRDQDLFRVRMEIEVNGNVNLLQDPLVRNSKKRMLPIEAKLALDYEERYLRPAGATADSEIIAAERHFHEATGTSRISRNDQEITLRHSVGDVIARRDELPETIYSNDDYLTHEEMDLLRTPIASTAIDALVPDQMMRAGEKVTLLSSDLASFFNLSAIASSDVQVELVAANAAEAKLQLRGKMHGSVSGVPTELKVVGKLTLDRKAGAVTWAAVAVHETREIGNAEPGFDVTATIRMVRKPLPSVQTLPQAPQRIAFDEPPPASRLLVTMASDHVGVEGLMDRRWRVMKDLPGEAVLRMIENDRSIAQLNLKPLPRLVEGKQLSLEQFQSNVEKTLGDRFGELIGSSEGMTEGGLRMLHVVVGGRVEGVPIQWIMMHLSDDSRRRVLATWTMDGQSVPLLAGSDTQLAASLRLTGDTGNTGQSDPDSGKNDKNLELSAAESGDEVESGAAVAELLSPSDVKSR
ncbi:hypothetical protein [Allorhodopirellula solitaria]|uniref:hypothetical protein n=1 Tax=Allorhodopirellula solitaria TaxID=2527987 RepID=UPI001644D410|nr:hypothetical protein [Allorhodopirellula solitaria]